MLSKAAHKLTTSASPTAANDNFYLRLIKSDNGNITTDDRAAADDVTYAYNNRNRYRTLTVGGATIASYRYNALGERAQETIFSGGTPPAMSVTHFLYDLGGRFLANTAMQTNGIQTHVVWLNDMPLAQITAAGDISYLHPDHLNTPQKMTNASQSVVWDRQQDPFGETHSVTGSGNTVLRFPGQRYDRASGLNYNMMRDYDPTLGRYIEADPIGMAGSSVESMNIYGYVGQNPVTGIDPNGLVKLYGSWCGPDWSGGYSKSYNELSPTQKKIALPPIDKLDNCCMSHDITYANCREQNPCDPAARQQCFEDADRTLSACASKSGDGQASQVLLFGNPKVRIENYMKNSKPGAGPNAEGCGCQK